MLSTPLPAISARKSRRYAIASMRDREALEATSLGELTTFVEGDGKRLRLANTFPLIAVAASQEGENELKTVLQQIYRLSTIPELPVVRVDEASPKQLRCWLRSCLRAAWIALSAMSARFTPSSPCCAASARPCLRIIGRLKTHSTLATGILRRRFSVMPLWSIQRTRGLRVCCANRRSNSFSGFELCRFRFRPPFPRSAGQSQRPADRNAGLSGKR